MANASDAYGEGREPIPAIDQPTVIFIINRSLPKDSWTEDQVYQATRCSWKIGPKSRNEAVYALGVSHGVVRGAYRIDRWYAAEGGRWCFEGVPATDLNVVDTSIARIKPPQGNRSAVRFSRSGIEAATASQKTNEERM